MPHKCVRCGALYPDGAKQLLSGCDNCSGKFFYFIKEENLHKKLPKLSPKEIEEIENDIKEVIGINEKNDKPIVLDLETITVLKPGKYEIDLVKVFDKKRPVVFKIKDGKYLIDLRN